MGVSAEDAIAKARQVLNSMGLSMYLLYEVVPGKEEGRDVWYVRALTVAGTLELVISRLTGELLCVRVAKRSQQ